MDRFSITTNVLRLGGHPSSQQEKKTFQAKESSSSFFVIRRNVDQWRLLITGHYLKKKIQNKNRRNCDSWQWWLRDAAECFRLPLNNTTKKACFAIFHEARRMIGKNKKTNGFSGCVKSFTTRPSWSITSPCFDIDKGQNEEQAVTTTNTGFCNDRF